MLTGKDIFTVYRRLSHPTWQDIEWHDLTDKVRQDYEALARELNKIIEAQQVTISAVRCDSCHEMLDAEHCENHACWLSAS
jgi:hypothetical protein